VAVSAVVEQAGDAVRVLVRNDGDETVQIARGLLAPTLAFEVTDAAGGSVALGPPPVPSEDLDADIATVSPGETLELEYGTAELFAGERPGGRRRLRFAVDASPARIESPWVDLLA
jgi:hypothetical protein